MRSPSLAKEEPPQAKAQRERAAGLHELDSRSFRLVSLRMTSPSLAHLGVNHLGRAIAGRTAFTETPRRCSRQDRSRSAATRHPLGLDSWPSTSPSAHPHGASGAARSSLVIPASSDSSCPITASTSARLSASRRSRTRQTSCHGRGTAEPTAASVAAARWSTTVLRRSLLAQCTAGPEQGPARASRPRRRRVPARPVGRSPHPRAVKPRARPADRTDAFRDRRAPALRGCFGPFPDRVAARP